MSTTTLWDVILGPTQENHSLVASSGPLDALMQESVKPREGSNPALGVPLASPESRDPQANPINGCCRRMIRFVGEPRLNSLTFIQCRGATL